MATQYQVNTILTNGAVINSGVVTLPTANIATSTEAGLVMPIAKTDDMTQEVGVDSEGKLYTAPGGGGGGSNIQIYHGYVYSKNGLVNINIFPSDYDLSSNYIIMFVTWQLQYGEGKARYYNTKFTYGYDNSLNSVWNVYDPENPDKTPSLTWQNWSGANRFNIDSSGATFSVIDIVAISIPKG